MTLKITRFLVTTINLIQSLNDTINMKKPLLDPYYCEIFRKNHIQRFNKRLNKYVYDTFPHDKNYETMFISSQNKHNSVDVDKCGSITVKDITRCKAKWSSDLFKKKKMNEELFIFCNDKNNNKKFYEGRLFKVILTDYEGPDKNCDYYFCFKIIERITPNGYSYCP